MGDNIGNTNNDSLVNTNNFVSVYDYDTPIDAGLSVQKGQDAASLQIPLTDLEKEAHAVFRQQIADGVPFSFDWTARENDSAQRKA